MCMAKRTSGPRARKPRLGDVRSGDFAADVVQLLGEHLDTLTSVLGVRAYSHKKATTAGLESLARWAQDGNGTDKMRALAVLPGVLRALYARAAGRWSPAEITMVADSRVGVVLTAAVGRRRLYRKESLPTMELAALTGLSQRRIRQLIDAGTLKRTKQSNGRRSDAPVTCRTATKLLERRAQ